MPSAPSDNFHQAIADSTVARGQQRFVSRVAHASDLPDIEALHDEAFGPGALTRVAYRIREGQPALSNFCRVMHDGATLVAALRFTPIVAGGRGNALMLGPLAVTSAYANQGHGRRLIAEGLEAARTAGVALIVLVGDPPYYERFGFRRAPFGQFHMPGPVDPARLLVLDLMSGQTPFDGRLEGAV